VLEKQEKLKKEHDEKLLRERKVQEEKLKIEEAAKKEGEQKVQTEKLEKEKLEQEKNDLLKKLNKNILNRPEGKLKFSAILFIADQPTINGHIYNKEIIGKLLERLNKRPYLIVQEMDEVERKAKKIPLAVPWDKKIMANVTGGEIRENFLIFHAQCRPNKNGRKLEGVIKNIGLENLEFFPVGYGTANENKVINQNYTLNYIAFEPKI